MNNTKYLSALLQLTLLLSSVVPPPADAADRTTNLVFKGCANQNFPQDAPYEETLQTLLQTLISQSSAAKFSNATSSSSAPPSINGLFQCRGDLSASACRDCVERCRILIPKLCGGGGSIAARIQLNGCYLSYALSTFKQPGDADEIYKVCDSDRVSGDGFGDRLGAALNEVVKGVGSGNGFYAGEYQDVYVMGQCEGDLGGDGCVGCVKAAVQRVVADCGGALSGQVYLEKCYVSYKYYPRGVNMGQENSLSSSSGSGKNTQKIVALVLGGVLGVGLVMACLLFTKSALKKKTHTYKYGG